jgi:hypothetical protein
MKTKPYSNIWREISQVTDTWRVLDPDVENFSDLDEDNEACAEDQLYAQYLFREAM